MQFLFQLRTVTATPPQMFQTMQSFKATSLDTRKFHSFPFSSTQPSTQVSHSIPSQSFLMLKNQVSTHLGPTHIYTSSASNRSREKCLCISKEYVFQVNWINFKFGKDKHLPKYVNIWKYMVLTEDSFMYFSCLLYSMKHSGQLNRGLRNLSHLMKKTIKSFKANLLFLMHPYHTQVQLQTVECNSTASFFTVFCSIYC